MKKIYLVGWESFNDGKPIYIPKAELYAIKYHDAIEEKRLRGGRVQIYRLVPVKKSLAATKENK